jgi:hypothetical protein
MNPIIQYHTLTPATNARDQLPRPQAITNHISAVKGHFATFAVEDELVWVLRLRLVETSSGHLGDGGAAGASGQDSALLGGDGAAGGAGCEVAAEECGGVAAAVGGGGPSCGGVGIGARWGGCVCTCCRSYCVQGGGGSGAGVIVIANRWWHSVSIET